MIQSGVILVQADLQTSGGMRAPGRRREPFLTATSRLRLSSAHCTTTPSCSRPPSARITGWPHLQCHAHPELAMQQEVCRAVVTGRHIAYCMWQGVGDEFMDMHAAFQHSALLAARPAMLCTSTCRQAASTRAEKRCCRTPPAFCVEQVVEE